MNARQELFAELVASGTPATVAYRKAGYSDKGRNAEGNACRMMENDGVAERIAALKAQTAAKAEFKRDDLVRILAAAIQTPIGEIDERNPLAQEYTEDAIAGGSRGTLKRGQAASGNETVEPVVIRRRVKCIGKIEAARLLCEIMGWKSPAEEQWVKVFAAWFEFQDNRRQNPVGAAEIAQIEATLDDHERDEIAKYGLDWEQIAWRRDTIRSVCKGDPKVFSYYYPSDDVSCWLASGSPRFDMQILEQYGFRLNDQQDRNAIIEGFAAAIRERAIEVTCLHSIGEYKAFITKTKGRAEAAAGAHDDDVLADCMAWEVLPSASEYRETKAQHVDPPDRHTWRKVNGVRRGW